jgi:branched-chain amino acid transport system permease protein
MLRGRTAFSIAIVISGLVPAIVSSPFTLHVFFNLCYFVILVSSLRFILLTGYLNLAHPAFVGVGAYSTAVLSIKYGVSFWLTLPMGVLITIVLAAGIGSITLKLKGPYFFLVTFAFAEIVRIFLSNWYIDIFGGTPGLVNVPSPSITIPSLLKFKFLSKGHFYYLGLAFMLASVAILYRLEKSRFGQVLHCIGQNQDLARSIGINVFKYKLAAFVIGASFASIGGSLFAPFNRVISPGEFGMHLGILTIVYLIIGGMEDFFGPVIGVCVLVPLSAFVLAPLGPYNLLLLGVAMLIVLIFFHGGIIGILQFLVPAQFRFAKSDWEERKDGAA